MREEGNFEWYYLYSHKKLTIHGKGTMDLRGTDKLGNMKQLERKKGMRKTDATIF